MPVLLEAGHQGVSVSGYHRRLAKRFSAIAKVKILNWMWLPVRLDPLDAALRRV